MKQGMNEGMTAAQAGGNDAASGNKSEDELFRVRRVTDGAYLLAVLTSGKDYASLVWRKNSDMAPRWTREQAHAMTRAVRLIWGGWMSLELEPVEGGGNKNGAGL